jgi:hypothetical protein
LFYLVGLALAVPGFLQVYELLDTLAEELVAAGPSRALLETLMLQ